MRPICFSIVCATNELHSWFTVFAAGVIFDVCEIMKYLRFFWILDFVRSLVMIFFISFSMAKVVLNAKTLIIK